MHLERRKGFGRTIVKTRKTVKIPDRIIRESEAYLIKANQSSPRKIKAKIRGILNATARESEAYLINSSQKSLQEV